MILVASRAKRPVELFVRTNPNPKSYVAFESAGDSAVVSCNPHRPCAWRVSHALKAQAGIRRVFRKANVSCARSRSDRRRQSVVHLPKFGSALRGHAFPSKSLSRMTGNRSGSARYRSSISSKNFSNFGRGLGSFKILLRSASPSSSGTSFGRNRLISTARPASDCELLLRFLRPLSRSIDTTRGFSGNTQRRAASGDAAYIAAI